MIQILERHLKWEIKLHHNKGVFSDKEHLQSDLQHSFAHTPAGKRGLTKIHTLPFARWFGLLRGFHGVLMCGCALVVQKMPQYKCPRISAFGEREKHPGSRFHHPNKNGGTKIHDPFGVRKFMTPTVQASLHVDYWCFLSKVAFDPYPSFHLWRRVSISFLSFKHFWNINGL